MTASSTFITNLLKKAGFNSPAATHWSQQRISSFAMIFLLPWLFFNGLENILNQPYHVTIQWLQNDPINGVLLALTVIVAMSHARLGLEVIIQDYIHHKGMHHIAKLLNEIGCRLLSFGAVLGIIFIVFSQY